MPMYESVDSVARPNRAKGKSENSWVKHGMIGKAVGGQVGAARMLFPKRRLLLIDANAGDGDGVSTLQFELFSGELRGSRPTPQLMVELAQSVGNADVCLVECSRAKRSKLWQRFGHNKNVKIVASHAEIAAVIRPEHGYGLWLSDPCGPAGHGVEYMRLINNHLLCDFVVVFNEGNVMRALCTTHGWETYIKRYGNMIQPQWWLEQLEKPYMARTRIIPASQNFHYRVLVISKFLSQAVRRSPFVELIDR